MCPAASALWKNGGSGPDAVWHLRSNGSSDEAAGRVWRSVHGKGYFWGANLGRAIVHRDLLAIHVLQRRNVALLPNYFGQTCYIYLDVSGSSNVSPGCMAVTV